MTLTFKEACTAVADLYEVIPETWTNAGGYYRGDLQWCAVGGVSLAMDRQNDHFDIESQLTPIARQFGFQYPFLMSDSSRENAIKLLRKAANVDEEERV